jgi:hypothetical protein
LCQKPGILNARLIFFYNIKKNSDLKINMSENHKSLFISFIFFEKKETVGLAGSLASARDPT